MIKETLLTCALAAQPVFFQHPPNRDDAKVFHTLTEEWKKIYPKRPAILFAYNYSDFAKTLQTYGYRAYSMTIQLSGGHLKGLLEHMPFQPNSLTGVVLMQGLFWRELPEIVESIGFPGFLMIHENHYHGWMDPYLRVMGFQKLSYSWHGHLIYQRIQINGSSIHTSA